MNWLSGIKSRGFRPTSSTGADVHTVKKTSKKADFVNEPRNKSKDRCQHDASWCYYQKFKCHFCKRMGYLARMCRCKQPTTCTIPNAYEASEGTVLLLHGVYLAGTEKQPYEVEVRMAGKLLKMQVNTGAAVSLVPERVYQQLKQPPQFGECDVELQRKVPSIILARGGKRALLSRD